MAKLLSTGKPGCAPCPELGWAPETMCAVKSADLWIPQNLPIDFAPVKAAAKYRAGGRYHSVITECTVAGEPYIRVPKNTIDLSTTRADVHVVDCAPYRSSWDFGSRIVPRPQQIEALDALLDADEGTFVEACGKGKTVMALERAAQHGAPFVVVVDNTGIAHQWLDAAQKFLDLSASEIGMIHGHAKMLNFVEVPLTDGACVTRLREIDGALVRLLDDAWAALGVRTLNMRILKTLGGRAKPFMRTVREHEHERAAIITFLRTGVLPLWQRPMVIIGQRTLARHASKVPMRIRQRFGNVFFDEAHHLPAKMLNLTGNVFFSNRISLTATPHREDGQQVLMTNHTGGIFFVDVTPDMPAIDWLVELPTELSKRDYGTVHRAPLERRGVLLARMFSENRERLIWIRALIAKLKAEGRTIIALSTDLAHPQALKDLLDEDGIESVVITGDTPPKLRPGLMRSGKVILATEGVTREGLDAPHLDTLLMLTPGAGWVGTVQTRGRLERAQEGKPQPEVFWMYDFRIPAVRATFESIQRKLKDYRGISLVRYEQR
jgi:superfamily II DNA or RNA helicase